MHDSSPAANRDPTPAAAPIEIGVFGRRTLIICGTAFLLCFLVIIVVNSLGIGSRHEMERFVPVVLQDPAPPAGTTTQPSPASP